MNQEETSFPRGGKPKRTSDEKHQDKKRPASESVVPQSDFLFGRHNDADGSHTGQQRRQKKRRKSGGDTSTSTSLLPIGGGGVVQVSSKNNNEPVIEALSFGKLLKGTKLLGIVRDVLEEYAVISLPNLLTGYILKRENEPIPLTQALSVGQVMSVVIVKTAVESIAGTHGNQKQSQTRRRIQVSALPGSVNTSGIGSSNALRGRIQSIEDHGCLVDLGHGRKGFLAFSNIQGPYVLNDHQDDEETSDLSGGPRRWINVGRLYDFTKSDAPASSSVLPLSLPATATLARSSVSVLQKNLTLASLVPGMLVQAKVEATARNGLCVSFLNNVFRGSIEQSHVGGYFVPSSKNTKEWTQHAEEVFLHKTLPARIVAVDVATKVIRLSLQPHLLNLVAPHVESSIPPVGAVVEEATVVRLDPGVGALLALPDDDTMEHNDDADSSNVKLWPPLSKNDAYAQATNVRAAYLHISKATDGRTAESVFAKDFAPSTKHTIRILSTSHWVERVASCATAKSIVEAHVLTHSDLIPGKIYRQVPVCGLLDGGSVLVDFGMGVRGLIPQQQLFDQSLKSEYRSRLRKEKYAVGAKVDVRCLSVDVAAKTCLLTAKKSLLKATDAVTQYEGLVKGQQATGYISKMDDRSLYVTFYNRVYGRVTARSLAADLGVEDHREQYNVGDIVKCRVINCRKRDGKASAGEDDEDDVGESQSGRKREHWELNLTLNLHKGDDRGSTADAAVASHESENVDLKSGAILPPKCMRVVELVPTKEKKTGGYIPGHAIVSIKAKYMLSDENTHSLPYVECKLPFDQLLDSYSSDEIESAESLENLARNTLTVGKKIHQRGLVIADPKKSVDEYSSGLGRLPIVSLREKLVATADALASGENGPTRILLPNEDTHLFMGAYVQGYVTQIHPRHGSFVRFLDKVTGLVPKLKNGLTLPKYGTVVCRVVALDVSTTPMKILLKPASAVSMTTKVDKKPKEGEPPSFKPGDPVGVAQVVSRNASRVRVELLDPKFGNGSKIRARVHVTMTDCPPFPIPSGNSKERKISSLSRDHPFYNWKKGTKISGLVCAAVDVRKGVAFLELTNRLESESAPSNPSPFIENPAQLERGMMVSAYVTKVPKSNAGLWVELSPGITGFIPSLEVCSSARILNNLSRHFPVGVRIDCCVLDEKSRQRHRTSTPYGMLGKLREGRDRTSDVVFLSAFLTKDKSSSEDLKMKKPVRGDLVVGRINRRALQHRAPALMVDLRGGFAGRCCITELNEMDDWSNMPIGRAQKPSIGTSASPDKAVVTDEDEEHGGGDAGKDKMEIDEGSHEDTDQGRDDDDEDQDRMSDDDEDAYSHGTYVQCRVLAGVPSQPLVEVSLRSSRLEGDLDDDELPEVRDMVQGYVIDTNKKGCFVRLARCVEGRATLKELCDGFLPDPASSFPMGRLVIGKVKSVQEQKTSKKKKKGVKDFVKATVDLDMRESVLLESQDKVLYDDIEIGSKHSGTVTRLEAYGVFVRLENSDVSGLAHKSECSDGYIKNLAGLYDPGDLVKVLVLKKDTERKTIGFSLKASHFHDDVDSDDESSVDDDSSDMNEDAADALVSDGEDNVDELDSDDENFVTKLAHKSLASGDQSGTSSSEEASDDKSESDGAESGDEAEAIDTNVGFDWGAGGVSIGQGNEEDNLSGDDSDDSNDESDEDNGDLPGKTSHKSRKRAAARRQEEQEISRRETALADGTADENPETAADFERLLASEPNRSENWIRYMAYHLSLADVTGARGVAQRAFDRIEFRQEGEKLNVWTALLTLELKYGSSKSLQETADRACQHNNPKQVYLRLCELLEKEVDSTGSSPEATARADAMYQKMCKKFKGKKTAWISHLHYLIKSGRHQEAHALLKRALTSLPEYKHVETMSRFAQLEMEHGSMERGRTLMDGLLAKYPKRLDLLFVYVDKEVKAGEIKAARTLLEGASQGKKLSDKQMKSLFKKWFRVEQEHGTDDSREYVKDAARAYVERTK